MRAYDITFVWRALHIEVVIFNYGKIFSPEKCLGNGELEFVKKKRRESDLINAGNNTNDSGFLNLVVWPIDEGITLR